MFFLSTVFFFSFIVIELILSMVVYVRRSFALVLVVFLVLFSSPVFGEDTWYVSVRFDAADFNDFYAFSSIPGVVGRD